jgi:hypothetical protein
MRKFAMILCLIILTTGATSWAQGKGRGRGNGAPSESTGDKVRRTLPPSEPIFTTRDRTIITDWFGTRRSGLPPGLAKRDRLPPGLEKQLRERGSLPPGLQKKLQPLPYDLERQLTVLPTGFSRVVIGNNVILMNRKTALIYDIIRSVIP